MNYIYVYTNKLNGHQYVGQTNNIERRKREHRSCANNPENTSYNDLFHIKLREYGEENFIFEVLEQVKEEEVNLKEREWITKLQTYAGWGNGGYNMNLGGENHVSYVYKDSINEIKKDIKSGMSYGDIHTKYGISCGQISNINNGKQYFDENETYPLYKYGKEEQDIAAIKELLICSTKTMKEIAEIYNFAYSTVKKINSGALHHDSNLSYPLRVDVRKQKAEQIKNLLILGRSNLEIITEVGTSASTIDRINRGISYRDDRYKYPLR